MIISIFMCSATIHLSISVKSSVLSRTKGIPWIIFKIIHSISTFMSRVAIIRSFIGNHSTSYLEVNPTIVYVGFVSQRIMYPSNNNLRVVVVSCGSGHRIFKGFHHFCGFIKPIYLMIY